MIVECIGHDGSDPSSAAISLARQLRSEGIEARLASVTQGGSSTARALRRWLYTAMEAVRSPAAAVQVVAAAPGRRVGATVEVLMLRGLVRRARRLEVLYLFDRAALTTIREFAEPDRARELMARPSWSWVLPDAVVYVVGSSRPIEPAADTELGGLFSWWSGVETPGRSRWVLELDAAPGADLDATLAECATDLSALRRRTTGAPVTTRTAEFDEPEDESLPTPASRAAAPQMDASPASVVVEPLPAGSSGV